MCAKPFFSAALFSVMTDVLGRTMVSTLNLSIHVRAQMLEFIATSPQTLYISALVYHAVAVSHKLSKSKKDSHVGGKNV